MEREGKADRSDSKHLHDLDGGNAGAIPERVTAELGARIVGDMGDGDLAGVDGGVDGEGDEVAEAIDGAAKEVEADKDVSYIFLHVWLVRKCRNLKRLRLEGWVSFSFLFFFSFYGRVGLNLGAFFLGSMGF